MSEDIKPHMSEAKIQLLTDSISRSKHYLEYGIGGSTILASQQSLSSIVAIDSSEEWIDKIHSRIVKSVCSSNVSLIHADLGKTADWGYPIDENKVKNWPQYYSSPWIRYRNLELSPDLILIDGRFRTSCFLFSLLNSETGTRILWDDYLGRPEYHFVEKALHPQGLIDDMAIFKVTEKIDKQLVTFLLFENLFNLD
jgi:hypothetical protein